MLGRLLSDREVGSLALSRLVLASLEGDANACSSRSFECPSTLLRQQLYVYILRLSGIGSFSVALYCIVANC